LVFETKTKNFIKENIYILENLMLTKKRQNERNKNVRKGTTAEEKYY